MKISTFIAVLIPACAFSLATTSHAQLVLQLAWDIAGKNAAPGGIYTTFAQDFIQPTNPVVTGGLIGLGTTSLAKNVNNAYRADFSQISLADAISNNQYLSLSVTNNGTINFQQLGLNLQTSTGATFTWNLFSDKTGFAAANVLQTLSNDSSSAIKLWTVDLTGYSALQNVATPTEFRIYGFRAAAGTSEAGYANAAGTTDIGVYAIPEPGTAALLIGALFACVLARRLRKGNKR